MSEASVIQLRHLDKLPLEAKEVVFAYFNKLDHQKELLEIIEGFYIVGSIALGDFNPHKSDINFVVLLRSSANRVLQKRLKSLHAALAKAFTIDMNGYYIPVDYLSVERGEDAFVISIKGASSKTSSTLDIGNVVLYELKQSGISIYGKPVKELHIDANVEDVITEMHQTLNTYWAKWLRKHKLILPKGWSLLKHPSCTEKGILGVARLFYTLQTGTIASKHLAGVFLSRYMKGEFADVIKQATNTRQEGKKVKSWSLLRYRQTRAVIQKTIEAFNKDYERFEIGTAKSEVA